MATSFSKCPPKIQFLSFINKRAYINSLRCRSPLISICYFFKKDKNVRVAMAVVFLLNVKIL